MATAGHREVCRCLQDSRYVFREVELGTLLFAKPVDSGTRMRMEVDPDHSAVREDR